MKILKDVTQAQLKEIFDYHEDGYLIWKEGARAGKIAGSPNSRGYWYVRVNGRKYRVHRLIYCIHEGDMPTVVDHEDGNVNNNKFGNLRGCTSSQNSMNKRVRRDSSTGIKGVRKVGNRYQAKIIVNGKAKYLGSFKNKYKAGEAYDAAAKKYFGEFAKLNFD